MRRLPLATDEARLGTFQSTEVVPKMKDSKLGIQDVTKDGVPKWIVLALYKAPVSKGGFQQRLALEEINIIGDKAPAIPSGLAIEFQNLSGSYWTRRNEQGENISGVSLSADAVNVVKGVQRQGEVS